jgi:hypothetical protein
VVYRQLRKPAKDLEDWCMAAKKGKGSDKAPKDLKSKLPLTEMQAPSEQELKREADCHRAFKSIFSKNVVGLSIGELGLGAGDPRWNNVIVVDDLTTEYATQFLPAHLIANLYRVVLKRGTEAPPDYAKGSFNLVLVEFEEIHSYNPIRSYLSYLISIFDNYYKDLNDRIKLFVIIISGSSTELQGEIKLQYGDFKANSAVIYLRNTDKEELFKRLESCREKGIAAEPLDILRLMMLQKLDSMDFELLTKQIELGTALLTKSDKDVSNFLRGIVELEWHKLSSVERDSIRRSTKMADYILDWLTDAKTEAKLEGKVNGIEETLARNTYNFLKKRYSPKVIRNGLEVSDGFVWKVNMNLYRF